VIDRRFGCSFWDYINRLTIDATCACLADADHARTIFDIACACGFTSKSTFNAAFKKQVGQVPSAWRRGSTKTATTPRAVLSSREGLR
jgi:AraC-like DNA-binding protein